MAITPADIEQLVFSEAKKGGYNTDEVDEFLDKVAAEIDGLINKIADLKSRLNASEQQLAASQAQVAQLREQGASAAAQIPSYESDRMASERQISQVLIVAQQSADRLVEDARKNADKIRNDAEFKAREVIRQALAEKQSELDEIDRLKQSREDFRSEYKKLLQHFIDDADAVFPQASLSVPNGSGAREAAKATPSIPDPEPMMASPDATVFAPIQPGFDDFGDLD